MKLNPETGDFVSELYLVEVILNKLYLPSIKE